MAMIKDPENTLIMETTKGKVVIALRPDLAPKHVERIKTLAREGFYDGIVFHRVIEGFMAQTGCPQGTGTGGSKLGNLAAEFNAEPHVRGVSAMFSPETGVVDSHGYMLALLGDVESHGGSLALNAPVMRGEALDGGGFEIEIGGEAPARIRCNALVNSAGLNAQAIARSIAGIAESTIPPLVLALTDQFDQGIAVNRPQELLPRLQGEYERAYYTGLIYERKARAQLKQGLLGAKFVAYDLLREAMFWYERAEAIRPPDNDDATLRWNACVRSIRDQRLEPRVEERAAVTSE